MIMDVVMSKEPLGPAVPLGTISGTTSSSGPSLSPSRPKSQASLQNVDTFMDSQDPCHPPLAGIEGDLG